jgi:hypothetical protein
MNHRLLFTLFLCFISFCNANNAKILDSKQQKVAITSVPKSGTNLLFKAINLLTGRKRFICQGFAQMHENDMNRLSYRFTYVTHAMCNEINKAMIKKHNIKCIYIMRDPRDQVVSEAYWMKTNGSVYPHKDRSVSDLMYETFYSFADARNFPKHTLQGVHDLRFFYDLYLPWRDVPGVLTVRFEYLVGPNGYDCENEEQREFYLNRQLDEIKRIATYLELDVSDRKMYDVARRLTGGTFTYRKGKVGDWKNNFSVEHEKTFYKVTGDLLEEMGYS